MSVIINSNTEFFNGTDLRQVNDITKLGNLTQEESNQLAVGPQDEFFNHLEILNNQLEYYFLDTIDVTNKWNWKPGSYNIIRAYFNKKLEITKKPANMSKFFQRTVNNASNYMRYITRQVDAMEVSRTNLKRLGYSKNVNMDEFKETCNLFVNKHLEQCDKLYDMTDGKVSITPKIEIRGRNSYLYYDILLSGLTLSVFDGRSNPVCIQEIPLDNIKIVMTSNLRMSLGNMTSSVKFTGIYLSDYGNHFVYIAKPYNGSNNYNTVCLDKHHDDIMKALKKNDIISLGLCLMNWAQYYNIKYANPYNQPSEAHIGMPSSFSKEYKAVCNEDSVTESCAKRLRIKAHNMNYQYFDEKEFIRQQCESIDCAYIKSCREHKNYSRILDVDIEASCVIEGFVGLASEYLDELAKANINAANARVEYLTGHYRNWVHVGEEYEHDNRAFLLYVMLNKVRPGIKSVDIAFLYDMGIIEEGDVEVKEAPKGVTVEILEEIEMKQQMMQWALESRG
tara:strand:+ start:1233 stop:2753 length:1521 start_codon:yes stop_codon:yes gene_type:complete